MSPLRKITWVLVATGVVAVASLFSYLTHTMWEAAVQQWVDHASGATLQLATRIDHGLEHAQSRLEGAGAHPAIHSPPDRSLVDPEWNGIPEGVDTARREAIGRLLGDGTHGFNALFVLLPNGDHYLSHPLQGQRSLETYNLAHRPYFQEATRTRRPVISDAFTGADGVPAVAIDIPILDESGAITSHLGGVMYLSGMVHVIESPGLNGELDASFLLDRQGKLIAQSGGTQSVAEGLATSAGIREFLARPDSGSRGPDDPLGIELVSVVDGRNQRTVMLIRLDCGWTLGVSAARDALVAQFTPGIRRTVALAAAFLVTIIGIGILLAWRIGLNWQRAEQELEGARDHLEIRVAERTAELQADIAERERIETALRASEEKFRSLAENSPDFIKRYDRRARHTYVNPAVVKLSGRPASDFLGRTHREVGHDSDLCDLWEQKIREVFETGAPCRYSHDWNRGDHTVPLDCRLFPEFDEAGEVRAVFGISRDISDLRRAEADNLALERQMQHAQKLESLGVMAGGIAHDFNNILMVVLGNADLALRELPPMSPVRENILEIGEATRRAADLAKQMLAYSGRGRFVVQAIDAGELVHEMAHLLDVSISKKVSLKFDFAEDLPAFEGDLTQVRQIVMNLITNASESIGEGDGVISLATGSLHWNGSRREDPAGFISVGQDGPLPDGHYIYLEVADTGCGMSTETLDRIFDPFFTTKFTGRGLGLSAVLGIVRGHRGAIRVHSEVGAGTTFQVLFPMADNTLPAPSEGRTARPNESWTGSGTVLVVDDEESVRTVGRRVLEHLGFQVRTASDGREALEVYRECGDEIVCVLLDWTMPQMDGEEAFRELRRMDPNAQVILCSGYDERDATRHLAGSGLAGFLQKPFTVENLQRELMAIPATAART